MISDFQMISLLLDESYLIPVGWGPSSNTCPRWAPQFLQVTSVRTWSLFLSNNKRLEPTARKLGGKRTFMGKKWEIEKRRKKEEIRINFEEKEQDREIRNQKLEI